MGRLGSSIRNPRVLAAVGIALTVPLLALAILWPHIGPPHLQTDSVRGFLFGIPIGIALAFLVKALRRRRPSRA